MWPANGEFFIFVDADTIASETVVRAALDAMRGGAVGGGAAVQFGIPKVIVGESANFGGSPQFMNSKGIEVVDLADPECIEMMAQFIREHADLWNEDIGK